jgi:hypothetical protein
VRFLVALALVLTLGVIGILVLASSSCVIDARNPDAAMDGEAEAADVIAPSDMAVDADAPDVDLDCGCCVHAILPLLPNCTGKVAFEIPATDCNVPCSGSVKYALCEGECFTACGCELPAGYTLFDAGYLLGEAGEPADVATDVSKSHEAGRDGTSDTGGEAGDARGGS